MYTYRNNYEVLYCYCWVPLASARAVQTMIDYLT